MVNEASQYQYATSHAGNESRNQLLVSQNSLFTQHRSRK